MKYLVKATGPVMDFQGKAYAITAANKSAAEIIAKEKFAEEYPVLDGKVHVQTSFISIQTIVCLIAMVIAVFLSFIGWRSGHDVIKIYPSLISCLYAAAFYFSYIVKFKGINHAFQSVWDYVFMILLILLFSSFIQGILRETEISLFLTLLT